MLRKLLVVGPLAALSLLEIWLNTLQHPHGLSWSSWAFYEWLINYDGGFVRRGLAGALLRRHGSGDELQVLNAVVFVAGAAYVGLNVLQALVMPTSARAAMLHALAPTGFVWAAVSNQHYYRKDVLSYIALLVAALAYQWWRRGQRPQQAVVVLGAVGACSVVLPFVHEAFLFFCVPFFALIVRSLAQAHRPTRSPMPVTWTYVGLCVALFLAISVFKGDPTQRAAIWASLSPAARSLSPDGAIAGGIMALGWSVMKGLTLTGMALLSGLGTYYLFPLALVYGVVAFIQSDMAGTRLAETLADRWLLTRFGFAVASFAPLFFLGWDWGRWIVGIFYVFSGLVLCNLSPAVVAAPQCARPVAGGVYRAAGFVPLLILCLCTRTPECCLKGSGDSVLTSKLASAEVERLKTFIRHH